MCQSADLALCAETADLAETGLLGDTGLFGDTGDFADTGLFGETGVLAETADFGDTGDFADTGVLGETGVLADTGLLGEIGVAAETGDFAETAETAVAGVIAEFALTGEAAETMVCPVVSVGAGLVVAVAAGCASVDAVSVNDTFSILLSSGLEIMFAAATLPDTDTSPSAPVITQIDGTFIVSPSCVADPTLSDQHNELLMV